MSLIKHTVTVAVISLTLCACNAQDDSVQRDPSVHDGESSGIDRNNVLRRPTSGDDDTPTATIPFFESSEKSAMDSIDSSPTILDKINIDLGSASTKQKLDIKRDDLSSFSTTPTEVEFTVQSTLELYTITAEIDKKVGFSLALMPINETETSPELLRSTRKTSLGLGSNELANLILMPGKYKVVARPDHKANITIDIVTLPAPEMSVSETGLANQPIKVTGDVSGDFKPEIFYLKPNDLDPDRLYTARLLYAQGKGQLIYTGSDGKWLTRESGTSPLTITGLLGRDLASNVLAVDMQKAVKEHPEGKWRLMVEPSENQEMLPEVGSIAHESSELKTEESVYGWLDANDKDLIQFSDQKLEADQNYYLEYKGPLATAEVNQSKATFKLNGRDVKLGPFDNEPIELSLSRANYAGEYSITKSVIRNKGNVATEPDSELSNNFDAQDKVSGELSASTDVDTLTFELGDTAQMWRVIVLGDSITRLAINSPFEELINLARSGSDHSRRLKVPDLYMGPGPVKLKLSGRTGDYKLFLKPLGPPRPNEEREPNQGRFYRTIDFDQEYVGTLPTGDRDRFVFFLEKPMTIAADFNLPPGAKSTVSFSVNGGKEWLKKSLEHNTEAFDLALPAGEILIDLRPYVPSPAEYTLKLKYQPFEELYLSKVDSPTPNSQTISEIQNLEDVRSFSLYQQSIKLPDMAGLSGSEELQLWTPSSKVKLRHDQGSYSLLIDPDFETGTTPIWIARVQGEQIKNSTQYQINAKPDIAAVSPTQPDPIPEAMVGGLNVAWAPLGATWVEQAGYEFDPEGNLPRRNPVYAASLSALNDGLRPLAGLGTYATTLSNVAGEIYQPILDLPGEESIPLVGIAIANRVSAKNSVNRFAVDLSEDGVAWETVLQSKVVSWTKRQFYEFPRTGASAKFVRFRTFQDNEKDPLIALTELEIIAKPGFSGLPGVALTDSKLGASGRVITGGHARSFKVGLPEEIGKTNRGSQRESGWTELGTTFSFKNQGIAEIEKVVVAHGTSESKYDVPELIRLKGSVNGPAGPFSADIELDLPSTFAPGDEVSIDLPERLIANAVNVEFSSGEEKAKQIVIPHIELIERPESTDYVSVLGTAGEFNARPYDLDAQDDVQAEPYRGDLTPLPINSSVFSGDVELDKNTNTWRITPNAGENTLELLVDGEPGFSPNIIARTVGDGSAAESPPLEKKTNPLTGQEAWVFDLPASGLEVTVSEPPRSTIFLMDESPSAAAYISRARRAVMNYADTMIPGKDRLLFKALGRDWSSEEWMSDSVKVRKNLLEYQTSGNSNGEGSLLSAADRLGDIPGLRSVVILTDGDVGPNAGLTSALAEHNVRVFVIKISSAKIWGDPLQSINVAQQWAELTQGELAYVFRTQDITTAYERISTRLLGPKTYQISASASTRVIAPGTLSVTQSSSSKASNQISAHYHVLFDASGSMLKRTGNTRRINTAKRAITKFVNEKLTDEQKIGLRVFGGEPGKCETELRLSPTDGSITEFVKKIESIRPKSYARTPIAQSLAALTEDLRGIDQKVQVIMLSDGEETCEGDAGLVIDTLIAEGTADRVDIVSFQLGDAVDRRAFKDWAKRGNGVYIDAQSGEELTEAFTQTVEQSYEVKKDGVSVATGIVGREAIPLSPATYNVKLNNTVKSIVIETGTAANLVF